jgi:hypothetical protein
MLPINTRIRAATEALLFVHPKLAVVATVSGGDLAERLEPAIERSNQTRVVNGSAKVIEHQPQSKPSIRRI